MMLPLERIKPHKDHAGKVQHWKSCEPFVLNSQGALIHRPRTGTTYNIHKAPHVGFGFWCGMHASGGMGKFTILPAPPEDRILCERCEAAAVAHGLPSAYELAGRHVHVGRTIAVATCCQGDTAEGQL